MEHVGSYSPRWGHSVVERDEMAKAIKFTIPHNSRRVFDHWWRGDGNTVASVGGDTATTLEGATYSAGKFGQAFSFDGTDDSVSLGTSNLIGSGQDAILPAITSSLSFFMMSLAHCL